MTLVALSLSCMLTAGQLPAVHAADSILGVRIAMPLTEAKKILDPLGTSGGRPTREGGQKLAWALNSSEFKSIALKTGKDGKISWVTGFLRPGSELPFSRFEPLGAGQVSDHEGIWTVKSSDVSYRIVAKGAGKKASVVYLLKL